jgi:curved DNA-binding protein CbpA
MRDQAFEILGIRPTEDERVIREAFVRLARIYHPDRFVGQPDDVRLEAERRMKDLTVAYESLQRANRSAKAPEPELTEAEIEERTDKYRRAIAAKHAEEEQSRARWRRWDEIEREARARADVEARIAEMIRHDVEGRPGTAPEARAAAPANPPPIPAPKTRPVKRGSLFEERLAAARGGVTAPLVKPGEQTG